MLTDFIAGLVKGFDGELLGLALNFLHCQDVDIGALKESDDAFDAGTN